MIIVFTIVILGVMAVAFGGLLGYAAVRFKVEGNPIVDKIEELLPHSQCGKCGYAGCRPYAEAVANNQADIDLCTPGGERCMRDIAELLDRPIKVSDALVEKTAMVAVINETTCIGCTLCIQACPVDAILGSAKHMHTVISNECTGCELCLPPCPVECIQMVEIPETTTTWRFPYPVIAINYQAQHHAPAVSSTPH